MEYNLKVTRTVPKTAEEIEKEKTVATRPAYGATWEINPNRVEDVLSVSLNEEEWKAVKKAVIEVC